MLTDLARALDPVRFAQDASIDPDPWQADLLRNRPRRALLNCSRQSGKTTTCAIAALETACHIPGSLALIGAPAQRQSGEMLHTVKRLHGNIEGAPRLISESVLKVEFENKSRIIALPGDARTIRGLAAPAIVILDEAAFAEDDYIEAFSPMFATNSDEAQMLVLSTPNFRRGWFFEHWHSGDENWLRIEVPASKCPRISKEFLAQELREKGPTRFAQEYECQFLESDAAAFPTTIIDAAFTSEVLPLWV
jgi:Terminase large subunit, T4likevirus-type, N-terminal